MDVIANAGAISSRVVIAKDFKSRTFTNSNLGYERDQLLGIPLDLHQSGHSDVHQWD